MRNSLFTLCMAVMVVAFMAQPVLAQDGDDAAAVENIVAVPIETAGDSESLDEGLADTTDGEEAEEAEEAEAPAEDEKELVTKHTIMHGARIEVAIPEGTVDLFSRNREIQLTMNAFLPRSDSFIALFVQEDLLTEAFASRTLDALPGVKYGLIGARDRQDAGFDDWGVEKILNEAENEFRETVDDERARVKRTTHYVVLTQPYTFDTDDGKGFVTATAHLPLRERRLRLTVTVPYETKDSIQDAQERAAAWADDMIRANAESDEEAAARKNETVEKLQASTKGMRYFVQILFVGLLLLVGFRQGRLEDGKTARAVMYSLAMSVICAWAASQFLMSPYAFDNIGELGLTPMSGGMMVVMSLWLITVPAAWFVQVCYMLATQKKYPFAKSYYRTLGVFLTLWTLMYFFTANAPPPA